MSAQNNSELRRRVEDLLDKARSVAEQGRKSGELSRRTFLKAGAVAGAGASVLAGSGTSLLGATTAGAGETANTNVSSVPDHLNELTIAELQARMKRGELTSLQLVDYYLARIKKLDQSGPMVNSIIEVNPDARAIAQELDEERRHGHVRGSLHGIPIFLKPNIDTADRMQTTAGSLALEGRPPLVDSTVAFKLRSAGAVLMGKTTLSEWANFRSFFSSSGWSGIGGQCNNPYAIDRNPCGSSSGSAAAVSANFTAGSVGTETDGSIVCPANNNGVVGIKPTVGLTSRAGVVPISHNQDSIGPHGRTVGDAAAVLGAIASTTPDPRDPATFKNRDKVFSDYTKFLDSNGLNGARIGIARKAGLAAIWGVSGFSPKVDAIYEEAVQAMKDAGATVIDPADLPDIDAINASPEFFVLLFDFKKDLNAYLASRVGVPIRTLADAIAFNDAHAHRELKFFGQEIFLLSEAIDVNDPATIEQYEQAVALDHQVGGPQGIDAVLQKYDLDALVAPTGSPAWTTDLVNADHFIFGTSTPSAIAGYPIINVPMGNSFGLPVGISFMGTAYSEPTLIKLASGFQHATHTRRQPKLLGKLPFDSGGCLSGNIAEDATSSAGASSTSRAMPDIKVARPRHL
jgi:amidase